MTINLSMSMFPKPVRKVTLYTHLITNHLNVIKAQIS